MGALPLARYYTRIEAQVLLLAAGYGLFDLEAAEGSIGSEGYCNLEGLDWNGRMDLEYKRGLEERSLEPDMIVAEARSHLREIAERLTGTVVESAVSPAIGNYSK